MRRKNDDDDDDGKEGTTIVSKGEIMALGHVGRGCTINALLE